MIIQLLARGGSKGCPGKHLRPLDGTPVIVHVIRHLQPLAEPIYINTDDPEIAEVAQMAGARLVVLRPPELATDDAPTSWAVAWLNGLLKHEGQYLVAYGNYPFVNYETTFRVVELMETHGEVICIQPVQQGALFHGSMEPWGMPGSYWYYSCGVSGHNPALKGRAVVQVTPREGIDIDSFEDYEYCQYVIGDRDTAPARKLTPLGPHRYRPARYHPFWCCDALGGSLFHSDIYRRQNLPLCWERTA